MKRYSRGENIFNIINIIFFCLASITMVYPFVNAIAISLSDHVKSAGKIVTVFPIGFNFSNYQLVFARKDMIRAAFISITRTGLGIIFHVTVTGLAAYALSIKTLPFKKAITIFTIIPMYLGAGMIAGFVNIYELKLMNSFWVYVFPALFSAYHMLIMRTFFEGIPSSLQESAKVDGSSDLRTFISIILPLSKPILATIALFVGVGQWNSWFDAMLYVPDTKLHPLAMLLRRVLFDAELLDPAATFAKTKMEVKYSPEGLKMAILVTTTLPIIFIYPFCQRYFLKGVMIGAVKG